MATAISCRYQHGPWIAAAAIAALLLLLAVLPGTDHSCRGSYTSFYIVYYALLHK
jgi:hypothetical protein